MNDSFDRENELSVYERRIGEKMDLFNAHNTSQDIVDYERRISQKQEIYNRTQTKDLKDICKIDESNNDLEMMLKDI